MKHIHYDNNAMTVSMYPNHFADSDALGSQTPTHLGIYNKLYNICSKHGIAATF